MKPTAEQAEKILDALVNAQENLSFVTTSLLGDSPRCPQCGSLDLDVLRLMLFSQEPKEISTQGIVTSSLLRSEIASLGNSEYEGDDGHVEPTTLQAGIFCVTCGHVFLPGVPVVEHVQSTWKMSERKLSEDGVPLCSCGEPLVVMSYSVDRCEDVSIDEEDSSILFVNYSSSGLDSHGRHLWCKACAKTWSYLEDERDWKPKR